MSTIEKLSIQGIRSFGPEESDKQVIKFFTPLTLILGPNGTGKTTIIECLKYMTTGDQPPGSTGGAFVHDPKVAHEREVKGQVRLQFFDMSRKLCVVQRSMVATQKVKKIEVRTLDGVITRMGPDNEKRSISSRCAELDREMVASLGVSKAVLENVIFCHQEDANWPLSAGKSLKDKFDAIFASTRYVKALDCILKFKKEQDGSLKEYRAEIKYLKQNKDRAVQYQNELSDLQAKLAAYEESVAKITKELDPLEEKLKLINTKTNEINKLKTNVEKISSEKKQLQKQAQNLRDNIENEFQGSTDELKRVLVDFQDKVQERQDSLSQFQDRRDSLQSESERLNRDHSRLLVEVGKLQQEAERHEGNIANRDRRIRKLAEEYEFDGFESGTITDEKYQHFFENMKNKLESMMDDAKRIKNTYEEKEVNLQQNIDNLRDTKTKLEQSEQMKQDIMKKNNIEIRNINRKLSEVNASAGRLDQLKQELRRAEHDLQNVESTINIEQLKPEIQKLLKEKTILDAKVSELSAEMSRLHLQSSTQAQLDVLKKDKTSKEENVRRIKAKHEDTIIHLMGHMPGHNIRGLLDDYIVQQSDSIQKCSRELKNSVKSLSTKEAERNMMNEQLKKKEGDLKGLEQRIFNVCGSQNFDDGIQVLQQKMSHAQDQRGSLLGAEHFFKKYVDDLKKNDPCCPLCRRGFESDQEVRELILELKNKLKMVPNKLQKSEQDLEEYQSNYDAMTQLKPLRENIVTLKNTDIPELKTKLKKVNDDIDRIRKEMQDKEDDLQTLQTDEMMARGMEADIVTMDRYHGEVRELEKKIATQTAQLTGGDSSRTLQEVNNEKEEAQLQLDTINRNIDRKRQQLSDHSEQVQQLRSKVNTLTGEKLQIDSDLQQRYKLEENKAHLTSENTIYDKEIKEAQEQMKPLQNQINKLKKEKVDITHLKEDKIDRAKAEVDSVRLNGNEVKNKNSEMKKYLQAGRPEALEKSHRQHEKLESKCSELDKEQGEMVTSIARLQKDLGTQKVRERELNDNLQLRKIEKESGVMESKMAELREKLGEFNSDNITREWDKLVNKKDTLMGERSVAKGRQKGIEDQILTTKKELRSDMYKDAATQYRDKIITLRTTEMANSDLEKYYKALDKAIMSYHSIKMEEINKIIRDLWRTTYRGNDIETIEIRSDDEGSAKLTRRNYNYRVVMIKGDAALDMRGRCSAGQKVLASLIIRLALAETFCLNCGILALDEPTTNLDRENIESLAHALVEIIKSRCQQRNFQLVIITHDEDFVELLGRSEYVDQFYKVGKNEYGCSRIKVAKVEDLNMR